MPEDSKILHDFVKSEIDEEGMYNGLAELFHVMNPNIASFKQYEGREEAVRRCFDPDQETELLSLGCGTGIVLERLEDDFKTYGLDASKDMLEIARKNLESTALARGDVKNIPFSKKFDGIFMYGAVNGHLEGDPEENLDETLTEVKSYLKEDGYLIFDHYQPINSGATDIVTEVFEHGDEKIQVIVDDNFSTAIYENGQKGECEIERDYYVTTENGTDVYHCNPRFSAIGQKLVTEILEAHDTSIQGKFGYTRSGELEEFPSEEEHFSLTIAQKT